MRNLTSTWRAIAKIARDRGESMVHVPVEGVERLVNHLQELDRVVIAAESFVACVGNAAESTPWSDAEEEGFGYLRDAVREATA